MISLPSTELVKWVHIVSITNLVRDSQSAFFCKKKKNISHNSLNATAVWFPYACMPMCLCVRLCCFFFLSQQVSFFNRSPVFLRSISLLCVPIQCFVFDWNYILYLECSRNAVFKATIGIDTTISRFAKPNATIVFYQASRRKKYWNRRLTLLYDICNCLLSVYPFARCQHWIFHFFFHNFLWTFV